MELSNRSPLTARLPLPMGRFRTGVRPPTALLLSVSAVLACLPVLSEAAQDNKVEETSFDTTFLRTDPRQTVDLARFSRGNWVEAGVYRVEIQVNEVRAAREDVRFVAASKDVSAQPCFTRKMLQRMGVDLLKADVDTGRAKDAKEAEHLLKSQAGEGECKPIADWVPQARADFDFGEQKLSLAIAQKYMRRSARGYVSPEMWEKGVTAGFLNYNANTYRSSIAGQTSTHSYLGLNGGFNIGGWRFRNQSSLTFSSEEGSHFDNIAIYVQHDVQSLKAQAAFGDSFTNGDVFDSVGFRGVQIASDDRMLPESQRGYAPVVRGTAQTNARVTIRQNGLVIYETKVSPGPFEITDLYPTGYGGNLDVTVTEADGRSNRYAVPYASVAHSLRPGVMRYSATAGQLRNDSLRTKPTFAQVTVQRGLSNMVTAYGGAVAAEGYTAINGGAALNTSYGAFSADITAASTSVPGQGNWRGTSLRAGYSKFFDKSGTNIALAAYRYSTPYYLNLSDAASVRDLALHDGDTDQVTRQRGRLQLTVNKSFENHGSVFLSASSQRYWNREKSDTFFQAGYTNRFKYGTYNITAGRTRTGDGQMSNQIALGLTIPLGSGARAPLLTSNVTHSGGNTNAQTSLSGALGERSQFSYNAYGSYSNSDAGGSGNAGVSGTYRGAYGQVSMSASAGSDSNQLSAGVSGSIVAHPGGVTLSQTVGDTFGIVHAPGAEGASVSSAPGVTVDSRGYAVVPYLTPYAVNTVNIDPKGSSTDVEFSSTSEQAVPRDGAVPMLEYETVTGRAALIRAPRANGKALPFGADVLDEEGRVVGVAAQNSRIFVRGVEEQGTLLVKWGEGRGEQCRVDYRLPPAGEQSGASYTSIQGQCRPAALARSTAGPARHSTTDSTAG